MGEASEGGGSRGQTAGARLSSSGGGGGREDAGEGESGAQLFSGVEGRAAGVQGAGGEQGARGGGNSQDDTRAGGAQAIAVGGRQDAGQGGQPTGRASGAATSAAPSSQASAASLFTEQFRLGQRGGGGFFAQQKQQLGPKATPSNSKQLSVKLPSALSFLGAHAAPRTPSQTPATSSSGPPLGLFGLVPPPTPSHNTSRSVDGPSSTPRPAAPARSTDQAPSQQLARGPTSALTGVQIHDQRQVNSQPSAARNGQGQLGAIGLNPASKKRAASAAAVGGGSVGLGSAGQADLPRGPGAARGSEGSPLPKKRKGDKTPVGGFEGIMASMTAYHNQAERKVSLSRAVEEEQDGSSPVELTSARAGRRDRVA